MQSDKENMNAGHGSHDEADSLGAGGRSGERPAVNPSNCWKELTRFFNGERSCNVCALNKALRGTAGGETGKG